MKFEMNEKPHIRARKSLIEGQINISAKGGQSYSDGRIILESSDGKRVSIVRPTSFEKRKDFKDEVRRLLRMNYRITNARLSRKIIKKLEVQDYVKSILEKS